MKKPLLIAIIAISCTLTPIIAFSAADDVFNCNKNSQASTSAGSTVPLGSPYVPVADYAVELNTGLLVYKECVLRQLADKKRIAALAGNDERTLTQFNGYVVRELGKEQVQLYDRTVLRYLENTSLTGFNDTLEGRVKQGIARGYTNQRDPRKAFVCSYNGDLNAIYNGVPNGNYWDAYDAAFDNPACNVLGATNAGYNALNNQARYEIYKDEQDILWGQGARSVSHFDENGFRITDTPSQIVMRQGIQSVQSPYVQAQLADDLGEMVNAMYLGMTNQVLTPGSGSSVGGLNALTQALGGALSYMGQVAQSAGGEYVEATANATIDRIQGALNTERSYNAVIAATASLFTQTNATLRSKELSCFNAIANAICTAGTVSSSSCTALGGGTLQIEPTTGFSQKVIDASIRTFATAMVTNLNSSNLIIARLGELIVSLRADSSAANQASALATLAAIRPHDAAAKSDAQNNQTMLSQQMATLIEKTSTDWSESEDTAIGWCNVSRQEIKDKWTMCWSGNTSACPTP